MTHTAAELPRRPRKPSEMPLWQQLREGDPATRKRAAFLMRSRRNGLKSAKLQRALGYPNLERAWVGRDRYWAHYRKLKERDQEQQELAQRRRELEPWLRGICG